MRSRLPMVLALWLVALVAATPVAWAGPRADVQKRMAAAMESYDLLEYETARKLLQSALDLAKDGGLSDDPIVARVHINLAIVAFAGLGDKPAARREFAAAVAIDPAVTIDAAYKTPAMSALLEQVRAQVVNAAPPPRDPPPRVEPRPSGGVDCVTLSGLRHRLVESAPRGAPLQISASLGGDIQATRVSVFYRPLRATEFTEVRLARDGDCTYVGLIPSSAMKGELLYYYVAAHARTGLVVASSGSPGAPNLIELRGTESTEPRGEAPPRREPDVVAPAEGGAPNRTEGAGQFAPTAAPAGSAAVVSKGGAARDTAAKKLSIAVGAATGIGYVTGETEQLRNEVKCCIAPGWFTLMADVGFALSPRLALGGLVRLGFPIGANIDGHSPLGPAAFVRARYSFAASTSTLYVAGQLGGGFIRNTLKLSDTTDPQMDTDVVALGPLLAGASVGYIAGLGDLLSLRFDLTATAGIPVVSEIDTSRLNFGVQLDATVGLGVHF